MHPVVLMTLANVQPGPATKGSTPPAGDSDNDRWVGPARTDSDCVEGLPSKVNIPSE